MSTTAVTAAELQPRQSGVRLGTVPGAEGLPSFQIHKLALDRSDRLWLAGPSGLACFDGDTVQSYDRRSGLHCHGLRSIAIDDAGTVWIGTDLGLEATDQRGRPVDPVQWSHWPHGLCEHVEAAGSAIWVGAADGLVRVMPTASAAFRSDFHAPIGFVRHIAALDEAHVFAATDLHGLIEIDRGAWHRFVRPALTGRQVTRVATGKRGELIAGTDDGAIVLDRNDRSRSVLLTAPGVTREVTALAIDARHWWVAYGRTLLAFAAERPTAGEVERYELDSRINDLRIDRLGNVWVATNSSGLALVSCLREVVRRIDIGHEGAVYSIKPRGGDRFDIGGEALFGTAELPADSVCAQLQAPRGLPPTTVWDSHQDASGCWVATHSGLYHAAPGADFVRVFADHRVLGAPARVLASRDGELWVGTLKGLARIRGELADEVLPVDGKPLGYVYAMHVDESARLWVATLGRGLWREEGGQLQPLAEPPLSAQSNTCAVLPGPAGEVAVLQDENVILLDRESKARVVEQHAPVAGWTALWMDSRTLAIGASDGLRLLDTTWQVQMVVRMLLSARDWEFTNNRTLVRDRLGRLLCGVNGGLVRVDLERLRGFLTPPQVRVAGVDWLGKQPEEIDGGYRITPGRWSFHVRAFSAWFVDHTQVRYRFKLIGFDEEWSPLRPTPEAAFNSLPPGRYELMAQAHSPLTGFGPMASMCRVTVATHWWAFGWSAALAAVGSLFDQLVSARSRNKRALARNAALEREVAERTAALHSANVELQRAHAQLEALSHTDALTQVANRRHFDTTLQQEIERARRQETPLSLLMIDVDHFKAINDRHGHQVGDDYLRQLAAALKRQMRESTDLVARYGGEEFGMILAGTDAARALICADRIRSAVAALVLQNDAAPSGYVTASIGVATMDPRQLETPPEFIGRADAALYEAKRRGRNRTVSAAEPVTVGGETAQASR